MANFLIRLSVGCIFLSEGLQKFLFADQLGIGRFIKIGIPEPRYLGPFVGGVEIACGVLILLGLWMHYATFPLIIDMIVAIYATKIPILIASGFWAMAHEARTDWAMLLGLLFLFASGAGDFSMDSFLARRRKR